MSCRFPPCKPNYAVEKYFAPTHICSRLLFETDFPSIERLLQNFLAPFNFFFSILDDNALKYFPLRGFAHSFSQPVRYLQFVSSPSGAQGTI